MRVIVSGRLEQRSYETREGEKRTVIELEVDEVGPSLRYATAKVNRDPARLASAAAASAARCADSGGGGGSVPTTRGARRRRLRLRARRFADEPPF